MATIYVVADTRERAIIPFLENECKTVPILIKQINVGDYIIFENNAGAVNPLACIERKTYVDFAASFCDQRYENINKMIKYREETKAKLILLIEGSPFLDDDKRIGAIPVMNIHAAINKLIIRDDFHVIYAKDGLMTAEIINKLALTYIDCRNAKQDVILPEMMICPENLKGHIKSDDIHEVIKIWTMLPGISSILGQVLCQHVIISDVILRKRSIEEITSIKTNLGREINKGAKTSLIHLHEGKDTYNVFILSGIYGISEKTANEILSQVNISDLLTQPIKSLDIKVTRGTTKIRLSENKIDRIRYLLNWSISAKPIPKSLIQLPLTSPFEKRPT